MSNMRETDNKNQTDTNNTFNILVIDDDPDEFYLINNHLKNDQLHHFDLIYASTIEDAQVSANGAKIDLILLDLNLGTTTGVETFEICKSLFDKTPIVVLTGLDDNLLGEKLIKRGAASFLAKKDMSTEALARVITYSYERHLLLKELEEKAFTDSLTGLANRESLNQKAETLIKHIERNPINIAVVVLDLDGFKEVNDRHGHIAGDELLIDFANKLTRNLRSADIVARIGGDEFVWVLTGFKSKQDLLKILNEKLTIFNQSSETQKNHDSHYEQIGVSIGACIWNTEQSLTAMITQADKAMYQSKMNGKNQITLL